MPVRPPVPGPSRHHPAKAKVRLRVDDDVIRFFRSMGEGHLPRMNAVLRAFMLARLAEVVKGEAEYRLSPKETMSRLRGELAAVMEAHDRAAKAAEDEMAQAAKYFPTLRKLYPLWEDKTGG